jgi:uncharacterized protein YjbI with pentapeptide repeats
MRLFVIWQKHLRDQFADPAGWKLIVSPLTFLVGFAAIVLGFVNYQSSNLDHEMEAADHAYSQLMGDAGNDSVRTRISAIHRIPSILYRLVPDSSDIGPWAAFRLAVGMHGAESPKYHQDMKFLILDLFDEIRAGNSTDPLREVQALINLLGELGPEGWYSAKARESHPVPEEGIQWLWQPPTQFRQVGPSTVTLFNGLPLSGIDLSDFALDDAELRRTSMFQTIMSRSSLKRADLTGTCASEAHFEFSHLDQANLSGVYMLGSHFESSSLKGALLDRADLSNSHFEYTELSQSRATGTAFVRTKLMGTRMVNASAESNYFDGADLTGADLSNSVFDFSRFEMGTMRQANLSGTSLRRADLFAADLSGANFLGVDLRDADLRNANLSGARNLLKAKNLTGANVAGVRGLSREELRGMRAFGATVVGNPVHLPLPIRVDTCKIGANIPLDRKPSGGKPLEGDRERN